MSEPVFISYARGDSAVHAKALADVLDDQAFLDTESIDDGDDFPQRLLDALLASRIVVIFASKTYLERRFCRVEMRLALHAGNENASHIVLASGGDSQAVRDAMPEQIARTNWPPASETARLAELVRARLDKHSSTLSSRIPAQEARVIASLFLEEASVPEPRSLQGIPVSFPPGLAAQSIGRRFVGRAGDLRRLHNTLAEGGGNAARLTSRISAGAGFGKTRLAIEYLYRYGPRYYPGGIFWVNAESSVLDEEFWRVLRAIDPATPDIALLRGQKPSIRERLEASLRSIQKPILYIADNVPEAAPGNYPLPLEDFCPALGAVTVLATSRQDTRESGVETIEVHSLDRDSAILLLRKDVASPASLSWEDWGRIAEWVGDLPIALELLNRALALGSISPKQLLARATASKAASATTELDRFAAAIRGQVREKAAAGVTAAFALSFEKLDASTQTVARILAQLAPTPIPDEFLDALPEDLNVPDGRATLRSRHFIIPSGAETFGVMHRLTADFLRSLPEEPEFASFESACRMVGDIMTFDRCRSPIYWPLMDRCRPHAEALFARGQDAEATAVSACDMGLMAEILASTRGNYVHTRDLEERIIEARKRIQGEEHPDTLSAMNNLAETLRDLGDLTAARDLHEIVLEVRKRLLGEEHLNTLISMSNLAETLRKLGDLPTARSLHESMNNLALTIYALGDYKSALQMHEREVEICTRVLGGEHTETLISMSNLAETRREQGDLTVARDLHERILGIRQRVLGADHPYTLESMHNLAHTLFQSGDLAAALDLFDACLVSRRKVLGENHPATIWTAKNIQYVESQLQPEPGSATE